MNTEERLIKEAQLMRLKARDFNPYGGLLTVWRGVVYGRGRYRGLPFEIEIRIPPDFPRAPPKVYAITPMIHPAVDDNGEIKLDILKKWNPSIHLYEVVNSLKAEFALRPPVPKRFAPLPAPATVPPPPPTEGAPVFQAAVPALTAGRMSVAPSPAISPRVRGEGPEDAERLKELLRKKEQELQALRQKVEKLISKETKRTSSKEELEAERDALKALLDNLEEKFLSGEIKLEEYAKLYKRYLRELYLIKRRLGEL